MTGVETYDIQLIPTTARVGMERETSLISLVNAIDIVNFLTRPRDVPGPNTPQQSLSLTREIFPNLLYLTLQGMIASSAAALDMVESRRRLGPMSGTRLSNAGL